MIDLADDYSWTVIGVPNQKWVWIMSDHWEMKQEQLDSIISRIKAMGYSIEGINRVPQKW